MKRQFWWPNYETEWNHAGNNYIEYCFDAWSRLKVGQLGISWPTTFETLLQGWIITSERKILQGGWSIERKGDSEWTSHDSHKSRSCRARIAHSQAAEWKSAPRKSYDWHGRPSRSKSCLVLGDIGVAQSFFWHSAEFEGCRWRTSQSLRDTMQLVTAKSSIASNILQLSRAGK